MSESPRNDPNLDSAQQQPAYNEVTVNLTPNASQDVAVQPASFPDATVNAPPDELQNGSVQSGSFNDATVDAPPDASQDGAFQLGSFNDATIDAPPSEEMSDATSCLTIDHHSTQVKDIEAFEANDTSFGLSGNGSPAAAKPKNVIANYEILGVLGRGAVGVVYKARQMGLNRLVALKMLLAGSHAGQRELMRFRIEAEAVARLHHPNIVQVYEVGEHNGLPFFSLEFVQGGSLHQKMDGKPLPPRQAAEILEALARAMHYAHQNNIIHRDLKPANVLITTDGIPKVTDFGLAKRLEETEESSQTRTGTLMGTPSYMSPEQASGRTREIGPLSDLYTLGAILYELLTGRPPFLGATMLETIQQVRKQEPVPPTQLQATTPHDLEVICLKALQKEVNKRYANAGEMADDLRRFLNGEPILARPVSLWERSWRWCRRNPRLASLYAVMSVLVLLVAVSGGVLGLRMLREQQAVSSVRDQAELLMKEATKAVSGGDVRRANDLLLWSDPLLESASDLREQHGRWQNLKDSIETYGQFKELLDKTRFTYIFGLNDSPQVMKQGQEHCRKLLALYDAIEEERIALPPLNDEQKQLFKEDVFDMFLMASLIERDLPENAQADRKEQTAQQALDWLNRCDKILPGMRTLYMHRGGFHDRLGQREESVADLDRARATQARYAVDRFWHGYAEHLRGNDERKSGDEKKAREYYRQELAEYAALLQEHPDHFWGYFAWARAKMKLGDLQDALIGFTTCIRFRPEFPWLYNNRGTVHLSLKQYDQAIHDYDTALSCDPEYVVARSNRALAYIEQGNIDLALKDCNEALVQDSHYSLAYLNRAECYRRRKQYEDALSDCMKVLERNEYNEEVHGKRAGIYEDMKHAGDEARFKRAVSQDQKRAVELFKQAHQHISHGERKEALTELTVTIELFPRGVEPYGERAMLYLTYLKDFDSALIDLRKVVLFWPSRPEAYQLLAMIHLGRRQYSLALEELQDALSRRADFPNALWGKAQIYLWQGKAKEALEVINPVVKKLPNGDATVLNIRGDIYRYLGQLDAAADDYRRLIQLRPEVPESYVNLALVYGKQEKPDKARQCLDKLVEANPKSADAYVRRGRFLRDQGLFEEAKKDSEQAAHCDAASVLPALLQASITAAGGDPAAAVAAAERALSRASEREQNNGQVLYSAVQVCALASAAATRAGKPEAAQRYSDRAVELLAQTLDKGFHDLNYPDHNRMKDDPALESIRQQPKARDLIAHRAQKNMN